MSDLAVAKCLKISVSGGGEEYAGCGRESKVMSVLGTGKGLGSGLRIKRSDVGLTIVSSVLFGTRVRPSVAMTQKSFGTRRTMIVERD